MPEVGAVGAGIMIVAGLALGPLIALVRVSRIADVAADVPTAAAIICTGRGGSKGNRVIG